MGARQPMGARLPVAVRGRSITVLRIGRHANSI
jgi:hypothetical protein